MKKSPDPGKNKRGLFLHHLFFLHGEKNQKNIRKRRGVKGILLPSYEHERKGKKEFPFCLETKKEEREKRRNRDDSLHSYLSGGK